MKKEISPALVILVILGALATAALVYWKFGEGGPSDSQQSSAIPPQVSAEIQRRLNSARSPGAATGAPAANDPGSQTR